MLLNNKELLKKSPLQKFNVYLLLEKKHPILIQSAHHFAKLLFQHEHKRLMHAGPQLLLASIRENYWPIGGRSLANTCYHSFLCTRIKGKIVTPLIGNLPQQRFLPNDHPFENVGVDYAGRFMCQSSSLRL